MTTLETAVADAILERASDVLTIDGKDYQITPPTPATLILVSELVSSLPVVINRDTPNIMLEVLSKAKDMRTVGKIVATLILGAKRIKEQRKVSSTKIEYYERWSWLKFRKVVEIRTALIEVLEVDWLAERLLDEVTNHTMLKIVAKRLGQMEIGDFFELTTSLSEANLIKRTREVETVSGD